MMMSGKAGGITDGSRSSSPFAGPRALLTVPGAPRGRGCLVVRGVVQGEPTSGVPLHLHQADRRQPSRGASVRAQR